MPLQPFPPSALESINLFAYLIHFDLVALDLFSCLQSLANSSIIPFEFNPLDQLVDLYLHVVEMMG